MEEAEPKEDEVTEEAYWSRGLVSVEHSSAYSGWKIRDKFTACKQQQLQQRPCRRYSDEKYEAKMGSVNFKFDDPTDLVQISVPVKQPDSFLGKALRSSVRRERVVQAFLPFKAQSAFVFRSRSAMVRRVVMTNYGKPFSVVLQVVPYYPIMFLPQVLRGSRCLARKIIS
ncbi:hypothetical protein V1477_010117 [Vespula maculifrons]|uniref:Uncharacterized protein n=2 Tax=Vespula TaxID=7451 RepID=A0A834JYJ1_VESVU|nr:hypothetical protein HZH66_007633 [Vespula vulgaris]